MKKKNTVFIIILSVFVGIVILIRHLIVEAQDCDHLEQAMRGFAVRIARGLNKLMGMSGPVFAERYHAHVLKTPREVRAARAYAALNAKETCSTKRA